MTTNAMPVSDGSPRKNPSRASRPPADAPRPTIEKGESLATHIPPGLPGACRTARHPIIPSLVHVAAKGTLGVDPDCPAPKLKYVRCSATRHEPAGSR